MRLICSIIIEVLVLKITNMLFHLICKSMIFLKKFVDYTIVKRQIISDHNKYYFT